MGEEERENGRVGGDPVGSTDPEVSRKSHPCTKYHAKMRFEPILALNAHLLTLLAFKRQ